MNIPNTMHDESNDTHDLKWLAYWLARYLLRDKVDKQGKPFIEHSMRVAALCADAGLSDEQQIAAILHDCVEDGELHEQCNARDIYHPFHMIIDSLFGAHIYQLVRLLTRQKSQTYYDYIRLIKNYPAVTRVKLADLADNLDPSHGPIPDSLRQRYEKAQAYLLQTQKGTTDK